MSDYEFVLQVVKCKVCLFFASKLDFGSKTFMIWVNVTVCQIYNKVIVHTIFNSETFIHEKKQKWCSEKESLNQTLNRVLSHLLQRNRRGTWLVYIFTGLILLLLPAANLHLQLQLVSEENCSPANLLS